MFIFGIIIGVVVTVAGLAIWALVPTKMERELEESLRDLDAPLSEDDCF